MSNLSNLSNLFRKSLGISLARFETVNGGLARARARRGVKRLDRLDRLTKPLICLLNLLPNLSATAPGGWTGWTLRARKRLLTLKIPPPLAIRSAVEATFRRPATNRLPVPRCCRRRCEHRSIRANRNTRPVGALKHSARPRHTRYDATATGRGSSVSSSCRRRFPRPCASRRSSRPWRCSH